MIVQPVGAGPSTRATYYGFTRTAFPTAGVRLASIPKGEHPMSTSGPITAVSRRTAFVGLGAAGAGMALAASARKTSAQDATPAAMAGHPIVGTWIVDNDTTSPTNMPSLVTLSSDGIVIDPVAGFAGSWEATGERTGVFTLAGISADGPGSYLLIRGPLETDEAGAPVATPYTVTIVGADGSVLDTVEGTGQFIRFPAQSGEPGTGMAGFPTWTPAPPAGDGTPAA